MPIPKDRRVVSSKLKGGKCGSRTLNMSGRKSKTGRYTERNARRVPLWSITAQQIMPGINIIKDTLTSNLTQTLAIMAKIDATLRAHSSGKCVNLKDLWVNPQPWDNGSSNCSNVKLKEVSGLD
jgi:hypothetical protein